MLQSFSLFRLKTLINKKSHSKKDIFHQFSLFKTSKSPPHEHCNNSKLAFSPLLALLISLGSALFKSQYHLSRPTSSTPFIQPFYTQKHPFYTTILPPLGNFFSFPKENNMNICTFRISFPAENLLKWRFLVFRNIGNLLFGMFSSRQLFLIIFCPVLIVPLLNLHPC